MSVEQEYIDIYRQFSTQIKQNAAEPTNAVRDAAFDCFAQQGFPTAALEGYQHSNLQERYAVNYGINLSQFNIAFNPYESFRCDVQSIKSHLLFVVNDVFCDETQQAQLVLDNLSQAGSDCGQSAQGGCTTP
jgi:Fe-S cluster assembly protein SufD